MLSTECLGPGLELNYFSKLLVPSEGRNHSLRHRVYNIGPMICSEMTFFLTVSQTQKNQNESCPV